LTLAELPPLPLPGGVKVEHCLQRTPPVKHVMAPARTIWFKPSNKFQWENQLVQIVQQVPKQKHNHLVFSTAKQVLEVEQKKGPLQFC